MECFSADEADVTPRKREDADWHRSGEGSQEYAPKIAEEKIAEERWEKRFELCPV